VRDDVRLVTYDDAIEGLMHACSGLLGSEAPAGLARLFTERDQFGFLVAPVREGETATSEDLKMLGAAAQVVSIAIENGCTLAEERQAMRLQVENQLLCEQTRTMEEMVHIVAHDLRSPMTAVYGFMHVALDELKDLRSRIEEEGFAAIGPYADSVAEPLRDGIRSVEKLNRMVQRLLEFSRAARAAYSFEKVDLQKLVQGVVRALGYQLNKRTIRLEVGELPSVTGDRMQLEAVFGNLIDNSIKYMNERGERFIEIGCQMGEEPIFYVRDTGIGMAPDEVSRAFIPFQRFNADAAPGDGIGLPHVLKIIERHGGRIWCESEKSVGTTFFFTLGSAVPSGRLAATGEVRRREAAQTAQSEARPRQSRASL
jgi:signal transduction histidine kinase